ncbi:hypothetical protein S40288_11566 [Stachybotrys chartarum IBT 40288]|nr:hypothetical protein S40288_11566 [Stachybotrys chartarum IBT 40288]
MLSPHITKAILKKEIFQGLAGPQFFADPTVDEDIYDPHLYDDIAFDYRTPMLPGSASRSSSPFDQSQQQVSRRRLPLLQLSDWDEDAAYDASPPTCIHYSIEWKLLLNKGRLTKLTYNPEQESDLVLAPGAFWSRTLKAVVEDLLRQKTPRNKTYRPEETNVVVSVSDRAERNLSKRFKEFDIEWGIIENQLEAWGHLFRAGRRLRVQISFICKDISQSVMPKTRQGGRRGATGRQHAELEAEQQEDEAAGRTNHWNKVYSLMRCPGPPCSGKDCLRGSGGKHLPIEPYIMDKLVRYSEEGNVLETHADVPQFIRVLIYEKDRADSERRSKKRKASTSGMPAQCC